ncbi:MAG: cytochrome P450 [Alphaproteobacteria bacterium]|nr:cytochrome P450 [Alphaproteobacteria bacterium]
MLDKAPSDVPHYDVAFYDDDVIADPFPHYAAMRALGPVVYLPQLGNYAFTHFATVRDGLRNHPAFSSAAGVSADDFGSGLQAGNIIASDPPRHTTMRKAMLPTLMPASLSDLRENFDRLAEHLVDGLTELDEFDAIADFASFLPLSVVRDLVGLPEFGKENMLKWGAAAFDIAGIQNDRGKRAVETIKEMRAFVLDILDNGAASDGSWARRVIDLVDSKKLAPDIAPYTIRDYINPSLDTTISATGHLIRLLSQNPDQWDKVRAEPGLAPAAIAEAVRLGTPIRSFARTAVDDITVEGVVIPKGARVMMLYASANRDEAVFENADAFDVTRTNTSHLGFGHGIHTCVGLHLAQMEMLALVRAMIPRVAWIETGTPQIAMNNTICGLASLPTVFHKDHHPATDWPAN